MKISLFPEFFLVSYAVGSTINDSPDCMWIKRSSLYLRPVLSLCHGGCWRGMCIINNIGSLDLKSSLLVLHISYNWTLHFLRGFIHSTRAPFLSQSPLPSFRYDSTMYYPGDANSKHSFLRYMDDARFNSLKHDGIPQSHFFSFIFNYLNYVFSLFVRIFCT